jgi:hypothetical protein
LLKASQGKDPRGAHAVDIFSTGPSIESQKLEALRRLAKEDLVKREVLSCLSDGMWHTTTELARRARARKPVMGLVTVGTMLSRMQQQLGEDFLEQMMQSGGEGVTSWRMGVEWLDVVREVIREAETLGTRQAVDERRTELQSGQPT